ncbi:MAG TPA: CDP-diacylglycerol--serine O-phosphatidyltransferase [Alphaproteobacteria bacterium]|nr:CDP-diacylglycerol--serine O-phosphatidyltransferase [Alphaproteobacteria bacterium]
MLRHDPHIRLRLRRPRLQRSTMNQLIPNLLTVAALCAGLTAIRFGLNERWDLAIFAIVVAGIFDGLDGRMARLLSGGTKFGAELDSLSDFVAFGVAPAMMLYLWTMHGLGGIGWAIVLLYAVCCALRLARFNTALGDPNPPPWARYYFTGVPAPAGAGLVLLPMMLAQEFGPGFFDRPTVNAVALIAIALLMVSRVPTFSIKQIKIPPSFFLPALLLVGLLVAALASEPFMTFIVVGVIYLASIPVAVWRQGKDRRRTADLPLSAPSLPRASEPPSPVPGSPAQSDRTV